MKRNDWIVPNDELGKFILTWAKSNHPDKYDKTLKVAGIPETFRRYMIRLIEIRYEQEGWDAIKDIPVSILDESGIVLQTQSPTGEQVTVSGALAGTASNTRFWELALAPEDFRLLQAAKTALDLEHIDATEQQRHRT